MPKVRQINTNIKDADIENYASRCDDVIEDDGKSITTKNTNTNTERISVSFSDEEMKELKSLSAKDGRSLSAFIRLHILNALSDSV